MDNTVQKAIEAATLGKWHEAIEINLKILKEIPDDVDALNRSLGHMQNWGKQNKPSQLLKK